MSVPAMKKIPWFSSRFSPHESNASLAPSKLSVNRDEPLHSWQDVVACAKNSVCYENDISTAPEPYRNRDEVIYELPRPIDSNRRHTIRHVMMRAKHNNISNIEDIMPPKVITPPLPKNIPPEILDDVKLFDFYYKNLDSIFITDSSESVTTRSSILSDDVEKRASSGNRISRMLSFGQQQAAKKKLMIIDESALNAATECAK